MHKKITMTSDDPCCGGMEAGDNDLMEMEGWCSRLRQENSDLQDALGKADVEVSELSQEIASLQEKNKSLYREISPLPDLKELVENLRLEMMQEQDSAKIEEPPKKTEEKRCPQTEERPEWLLHQMDHSQEETIALHEEATRWKFLISELEKKLQSKRLELKEKEGHDQERESTRRCMMTTLNEYTSTIEVLRHKVVTLQSQVKESAQDIALRKTMDVQSQISRCPQDDGTLMYEILQAKLDDEEQQWKDQQKWSFRGLRWLHALMLKGLWCNAKVAFFSGFFILLSHYLGQGQEPGFLGWCIWSIVSYSETTELMERILQPCLQLNGSGMTPT